MAVPTYWVTEACPRAKRNLAGRVLQLSCKFVLRFRRRIATERPLFEGIHGTGAPMARVTVEDCIDKVDNRFDLVLLASHRARTISSGSQITVERDNDKNPVVALREIAEKTISPDDLKEELVHS